MRISLGIDPGWKNLGWALVKEEEGQLTLLTSQTICPADIGISKVPEVICSTFKEVVPNETLRFLTIERYVSYQNILTAESEQILMTIGSLLHGLPSSILQSSDELSNEITPCLLRAIDWKMELVKTLVRIKGFDNPSTDLDKKFSIAAANACLDNIGNFKTDHEADAICLACLPFLREKRGLIKSKQ